MAQLNERVIYDRESVKAQMTELYNQYLNPDVSFDNYLALIGGVFNRKLVKAIQADKHLDVLFDIYEGKLSVLKGGALLHHPLRSIIWYLKVRARAITFHFLDLEGNEVTDLFQVVYEGDGSTYQLELRLTARALIDITMWNEHSLMMKDLNDAEVTESEPAVTL